jgi:hypothetical protein
VSGSGVSICTVVLVIQANVTPASEVSLNAARESIESIEMFASCEACEACKHRYMSVRPYVCMSVYICTYIHISMYIYACEACSAKECRGKVSRLLKLCKDCCSCSIRQHTSAYVRKRQQTSADFSRRQHAPLSRPSTYLHI